MSPDDEALPLLLALSSGIKGMTTIHAASAEQALQRLRFVSQLSDRGGMPMAALNHLVTDGIDLVVQCSRSGERRQVESIVAVEALAGGESATRFTTTPVFRRGPTGRLIWTGHVPSRLGDQLAVAGYDIRAELSST